MTATVNDLIPTTGPTDVEIDTERAVLRGAIETPGWAPQMVQRLAADDFVRPVHQLIYGMIVDALAKGLEPSLLVISHAAQSTGNIAVIRYVTDLMVGGSAMVFDMFLHYVAQVSNYSYIRQVNIAGIRLSSLAAGATLEEIEAVREQAALVLAAAESPTVDEDSATWDELYLRDVHAAKNPVAVNTVPVPYRKLAQLLNGGLRPGNLVVVGARPALGKSLLAAEFARHAAINGVNTMLVTLEMNHREISARLMSSTSKVLLSRTVTMTEQEGVLDDEDWRKLRKGYDEIVVHHGRNLTVVDPTSKFTVSHLERRLVAMQRKGTPFGLVVLDYLQLLESMGLTRAENRQVEVQKMSRELKLLAKKFDIPIIVLAQLNRGPEQRTDHKPLLSDFRESGSLEQDANVVILLHREEVYDPETARAGEIDLIVAKNRNGATGVVVAAFRGHYALIDDMPE